MQHSPNFWNGNQCITYKRLKARVIELFEPTGYDTFRARIGYARNSGLSMYGEAANTLPFWNSSHALKVMEDTARSLRIQGEHCDVWLTCTLNILRLEDMFHEYCGFLEICTELDWDIRDSWAGQHPGELGWLSISHHTIYANMVAVNNYIVTGRQLCITRCTNCYTWTTQVRMCLNVQIVYQNPSHPIHDAEPAITMVLLILYKFIDIPICLRALETTDKIPSTLLCRTIVLLTHSSSWSLRREQLVSIVYLDMECPNEIECQPCLLPSASMAWTLR